MSPLYTLKTKKDAEKILGNEVKVKESAEKPVEKPVEEVKKD